MQRLATVAAIAVGLLAFAPWGTVSVRLLGVWPPGLDFKGTEIDSGLGIGLATGWIVVLLAFAALMSSSNPNRLVTVAVALLAYTAYNAATLSHHTLSVSVAANGQNISNLGARVSVGFGAIAELAAAAVLVAAAIGLRRRDQTALT